MEYCVHTVYVYVVNRYAQNIIEFEGMSHIERQQPMSNGFFSYILRKAFLLNGFECKEL